MTTATRQDLEALLTDSRYALRQCRDHRDPSRAADALERIEGRLDRLLEEAVEPAELEAIDFDGPTPEEEAEMHALCDSHGWYEPLDEDDLPF